MEAAGALTITDDRQQYDRAFSEILEMMPATAETGEFRVTGVQVVRKTISHGLSPNPINVDEFAAIRSLFKGNKDTRKPFLIQILQLQLNSLGKVEFLIQSHWSHELIY
jgi:hypothetical protein